jgi:thiol-disulfide isomerase/thioredoxin
MSQDRDDIKDQMKNVYYLEDMDFSNDGTLVGFKKIKNNRPTLVMVYADWCPHCVHFKPEVQKISDEMNNETGKVNIAAIRADGKFSEEEKMLGKRVKDIFGDKGFRGFPHVSFFDKNGKFKANFEDERSAKALKKFIENNL